MPGLFNDSDESDDSDTNIVDQSKRKRSSMSMDIAKSSDGGGSVFRDMAAKFQANVRKRQRYTYRVLQTVQMKLILLCVCAEPAVLGSTKTALKFKYEI